MLKGKQLAAASGLCLLAAASVGIAINCYSVFYTPIAEGLGIPLKAVSTSATVSSLLLGFLSPLSIRLLRRFKPLLVCLTGILLTALSYVVLALAKGVVPIYIAAVMRGCGLSAFYYPVITLLLGCHITEGRGTVTGVVMSFSGITGAVLSPVFTSLIASAGWRVAMYGMGAFTLVAVPGILLSGNVTLPAAPAPVKRSRGNISPLFLLLATFTAIISALTAVVTFYPAFSVAAGLGAMTGAAMLSAAMISNIVSKLVIGFLADWLGVFRASLILGAVMIIGLFALAFVGAPALLIGAAALSGAMYGLSAVSPSLLTRLFWPEEAYGTLYPLLNLIGSVAYAVVIALIGIVIDAGLSYRTLFLASGVFGTVSLLLLPGMLALGKRR